MKLHKNLQIYAKLRLKHKQDINWENGAQTRLTLTLSFQLKWCLRGQTTTKLLLPSFLLSKLPGTSLELEHTRTRPKTLRKQIEIDEISSLKTRLKNYANVNGFENNLKGNTHNCIGKLRKERI